MKIRFRKISLCPKPGRRRSLHCEQILPRIGNLIPSVVIFLLMGCYRVPPRVNHQRVVSPAANGLVGYERDDALRQTAPVL